MGEKQGLGVERVCRVFVLTILVVVAACSGDSPGTGLGETGGRTEAAGRALRAAPIAAVQADAGPAYGFRDSDEGAASGTNPAHQLDVQVGATGLTLVPAPGDGSDDRIVADWELDLRWTDLGRP